MVTRTSRDSTGCDWPGRTGAFGCPNFGTSDRKTTKDRTRMRCKNIPHMWNQWSGNGNGLYNGVLMRFPFAAWRPDGLNCRNTTVKPCGAVVNSNSSRGSSLFWAEISRTSRSSSSFVLKHVWGEFEAYGLWLTCAPEQLHQEFHRLRVFL